MNAVLAPMLALILWTLVMCVWLFAVRIPAMAKAGVKPGAGKSARDLGGLLPPSVTRVADNYNHLHEQPTLFYALCAYLALAERGDAVSVTLMWVYVGLRIVHSLVQATVNHVLMRFSLFILSAACLAVVSVREALALFGIGI